MSEIVLKGNRINIHNIRPHTYVITNPHHVNVAILFPVGNRDQPDYFQMTSMTARLPNKATGIQLDDLIKYLKLEEEDVQGLYLWWSENVTSKVVTYLEGSFNINVEGQFTFVYNGLNTTLGNINYFVHKHTFDKGREVWLHNAIAIMKNVPSMFIELAIDYTTNWLKENDAGFSSPLTPQPGLLSASDLKEQPKAEPAEDKTPVDPKPLDLVHANPMIVELPSGTLILADHLLVPGKRFRHADGGEYILEERFQYKLPTGEWLDSVKYSKFPRTQEGFGCTVERFLERFTAVEQEYRIMLKLLDDKAAVRHQVDVAKGYCFAEAVNRHFKGDERLNFGNPLRPTIENHELSDYNDSNA